MLEKTYPNNHAYIFWNISTMFIYAVCRIVHQQYRHSLTCLSNLMTVQKRKRKSGEVSPSARLRSLPLQQDNLQSVEHLLTLGVAYIYRTPQNFLYEQYTLPRRSCYCIKLLKSMVRSNNVWNIWQMRSLDQIQPLPRVNGNFGDSRYCYLKRVNSGKRCSISLPRYLAEQEPKMPLAKYLNQA